MQKKIFLSIVILVSLFSSIKFVYPDTFPPIILHTPLKEIREGMDLNITCSVIDDGVIESVKVYFRGNKEETFLSLPLTTYSGNLYQAVIPATKISSPQLEYYFEAKDSSGNITREPKFPAASPYSLRVIPLKPEKTEKPKPAGNYTLTIWDSTATYPTAPEQPNKDLIAAQPGTWINYNLNMIQQSKNRTWSFWLNRETESYRGRTWDKFRVSLTDYGLQKNFIFGDFYADFSKLSLDNISVTGLGIKSFFQKNNYQVIAARSQRSVEETPKSSPIYRQYLIAFRQEIDLDRKNKISLNLGYSADDPDSIPAPTSNVFPQQTAVLTFQTEHKIKEDLKLETEIGTNSYDDNLNDEKKSESDSAYRIKLSEESENLRFNAVYQRIGTKYVSCGTLESYMENDKKGYLFDFEYTPVSLLSFAGRYERYKDNLDNSLSGTTTTRENSLSLTLTPQNLPAITGRIGELKRKGESFSKSITKGIGTSYTLKGRGNFQDTFILGNYQRINYEASSVNLKIDMFMLNFNTGYKDKISLSLSHNYDRTEDVSGKTFTRKKINSLGVTYVAIPFKYVTVLSYQYTKNTKDDSSVYNREESISWTNNYNLTDTKMISIGLKLVSYSDKINSDNDYENTVVTFKFSQSF